MPLIHSARAMSRAACAWRNQWRSISAERPSTQASDSKTVPATHQGRRRRVRMSSTTLCFQMLPLGEPITSSPSSRMRETTE